MKSKTFVYLKLKLQTSIIFGVYIYTLYIVTEKEITDKFKWVRIGYSCPGVREEQTFTYSSRIGVSII